MIDEQQLAEWGALADAATLGPWEDDYQGERGIGDYVIRCLSDDTTTVIVLRMNDAEYDDDVKHDFAFIAAARTAVPALLAEVKSLREQLKRRSADGEYCGVCGDWFDYDDMHYGTLGDDAGWVCGECIKENDGVQWLVTNEGGADK